MIEQYVPASSLSCLLNQDISVEKLPEPFRMQGSISFRVTYSEYSEYVLSLPLDTQVILMLDCQNLRNLAANGNPVLYSWFLKDMAFAICKEIWYSEAYQKDASIILPASFNGNNIKVSDCLSYYSVSRGVESLLVHRVLSAGFESRKIQRFQNQYLFQLAVTLYYLSTIPSGMEEVNLVYDLQNFEN